GAGRLHVVVEALVLQPDLRPQVAVAAANQRIGEPAARYVGVAAGAQRRELAADLVVQLRKAEAAAQPRAAQRHGQAGGEGGEALEAGDAAQGELFAQSEAIVQLQLRGGAQASRVAVAVVVEGAARVPGRVLREPHHQVRRAGLAARA